jgi:hypothetical protein
LALINTLYRLKDLGQIAEFEMVGRERAYVRLFNGKSITVYMPVDYIIGAAAIREALAREPYPDYIIYNNWNRITPEAEAEVGRMKVPFVKYGRFRHILEELTDVTD